MFETLVPRFGYQESRTYWMNLVGNSTHNTYFRFMGYMVFVLDGKAYLFSLNGPRVLRADWFQLCDAMRKWKGGAK